MTSQDTLGTNAALAIGQTLSSADGSTVLTMQPDGNLVLTGHGNQLWTSGTQGQTVQNAFMEWDGKLYIQDNNGKKLWDNGASGHKDAFLRLNNDGSMFVWDGSNHQIWDSGTRGFKVNPKPGGAGAKHTDFGGIDEFLKEAANTCGDVMMVVGPIVAVVINIIPGIGQAASAAIAAGLVAATAAAKAAKEVANGNKDALATVADAVASAIPGGDDPTVQAALTTASNAVSSAASGNIDTNQLLSDVSNLSATPAVKSALGNVAQGLASGLQVDSPQITAAMQSLPVKVQAAIKIGTMTANSAILNSSNSPTPAVLTALSHLGLQRIATDPISAQGQTLVGQGLNGYQIGLGATFNKTTVGNLGAIRNQLSPADQKGFDMALAQHIGGTVHPPPPPTNAAAHAAYNITLGMGSAPSNAKASMMTNLANHPQARAGAITAVKVAAAKKEDEGWFHALLKWLHLIS